MSFTFQLSSDFRKECSHWGDVSPLSSLLLHTYYYITIWSSLQKENVSAFWLFCVPSTLRCVWIRVTLCIWGGLSAWGPDPSWVSASECHSQRPAFSPDYRNSYQAWAQITTDLLLHSCRLATSYSAFLMKRGYPGKRQNTTKLHCLDSKADAPSHLLSAPSHLIQCKRWARGATPWREGKMGLRPCSLKHHGGLCSGCFRARVSLFFHIHWTLRFGIHLWSTMCLSSQPSSNVICQKGSVFLMQPKSSMMVTSYLHSTGKTVCQA